MKIALVDDERAARERLSALLTALLGADCAPACFADGESFLSGFRRGAFDAVILDIFMPGMSGVELARAIRALDTDVRLVFATTSNEFASESYEVSACYYLRKPFSAERVEVMLSRLRLDELERERAVTLPDGQSVLLREIVYADCAAHTVTIHNRSGGDVTTRVPLSEVEALLCADPAFCSPAKGLIVSFRAVSAQSGNVFVMSGGAHVPISRRKARDVLEAYAAFRFEALRRDGERK